MTDDTDPLIEAATKKLEILAVQIPELLEQQRVLSQFVAGMSAIGRAKAFPKAAEEAPPPVRQEGVPQVERPTKKDRVRQAIREFLAIHGNGSRKDLLEHLAALGLMGHESAPIKRLGTLLSMFKDEFGSDGKGNYSLLASSPITSRQVAPEK